MYRILRTLLLAGACLPVFAHEAVAPPAPAQALDVFGAVEQRLAIKADDLRAFPAAQQVVLQLPGRDPAPGAPSQVKGVRLRDILERAKLVVRDHNTVKKLAIIASASDGYKAVFSWNELFNSELGASALVLYERDGKPLGAGEGPLALVSGKDIRTGPRHVKWLQSIEVRQIVE